MADDTDKTVDEILRTLDLEGFAAITGDVTDAIHQAARSGGREALMTLGISEDDSADLFSQVDADALEFATKRGAELVGMRIDEDGNLIPNPDARWAITDGTRELLRATVRQAIEEGQSAKQLADAVRDNYAFSEARARAVGRTEIARAVEAGNLAGWKKSGVVRRVRWLLGSEHDEEHDRDECDENAEAGAIDLGQAFPSGDDAPPAHPNACFAGTLFAPYGSLKQLLRARYHGPAVTIRARLAQRDEQPAPWNLRDALNVFKRDVLLEQLPGFLNLGLGNRGRVAIPIGPTDIHLTIGPNHPMLSRRGWIIASQLTAGDELLYDLRTEVSPVFSARIDANRYEMMLFEDAFESLLAKGSRLTTGARDNFHGDETFCEGEVEAVRPAGQLLPILDPCGVEQLCECPLMGTYPQASHVARCSACQATFNRFFLAASRPMRRFDLLSALFGRSTRPPFLHRVRVISCHMTTFSGWAFDATTEHSIYNAGGIVVKNCECALVAETEEGGAQA